MEIINISSKKIAVNIYDKKFINELPIIEKLAEQINQWGNILDYTVINKNDYNTIIFDLQRNAQEYQDLYKKEALIFKDDSGYNSEGYKEYCDVVMFASEDDEPLAYVTVVLKKREDGKLSAKDWTISDSDGVASFSKQLIYLVDNAINSNMSFIQFRDQVLNSVKEKSNNTFYFKILKPGVAANTYMEFFTEVFPVEENNYFDDAKTAVTQDQLTSTNKLQDSTTGDVYEVDTENTNIEYTPEGEMVSVVDQQGNKAKLQNNENIVPVI